MQFWGTCTLFECQFYFYTSVIVTCQIHSLYEKHNYLVKCKWFFKRAKLTLKIDTNNWKKTKTDTCVEFSSIEKWSCRLYSTRLTLNFQACRETYSGRKTSKALSRASVCSLWAAAETLRCNMVNSVEEDTLLLHRLFMTLKRFILRPWKDNSSYLLDDCTLMKTFCHILQILFLFHVPP